MADLLPCPFCGGAAERIEIEEPGDNFGGTCIGCQRCGACGPVNFDRKENLVSSWNDRPPLPSRAARDVFAERARQIEEEDWTSEHDDGWPADTLALAGSCYALPTNSRRSMHSSGVPLFTVLWPWDREFWKPTDRRRDLVKAGALILAEIERIDRATAKRGRE